MEVLITGATGFIGNALISRLASDNKVIGTDITENCIGRANITWEQADLSDSDAVAVIFEKYSPDVIIHCAGIAHQKIGAIDFDTYMRVNSEATENLAKAASKSNPSVCFVFLSSVSVYGEKNFSKPVYEADRCIPSSHYARSKLDAEIRLTALFDEGHLQRLILLRLAPVYDREWTLNLDRRVLAPLKFSYLRFGTGTQKISALARPNLIDFIASLIHRLSCIYTDNKSLRNNRSIKIYNVCDSEHYSFNRIIQAFIKSGVHPNRPVIAVPLSPVWIVTRVAGKVFPRKKDWFHSWYEKLGSNLIFDNTKLMGTGFKQKHSLETIFDPQSTQINTD